MCRILAAAPLISGLLIAAAVAGEPAKEAPADPKKAADLQKVHQYMAAECFNQCWTLIDKTDRSDEEDESMLLLAYASLSHWKQRADCKPMNLSIGYWQVSRVHALLGQYEMAKLFGEKCLKVGQESKLQPFYVGYAHEALARAAILHQDFAAARAHLAKARKELASVTDKEARGLLSTDVATLDKAIPAKAEASGGK